MSEFMAWIDFDKKQYLGSGPFECDFKVGIPHHVGEDMTDAACTLLASDWHSDFVAFVGDQTDMPERDDPGSPIPDGWKKIREAAGRHPYDYAEDWYDDIAGMFKVARGKTGWFSVRKGPDGDFDERPYEGPFDRDIVHYRYVIDDAKRLFYDRGEAPVSQAYDPLPLLMSTSWGLLDIRGESYCGYDGLWMGDTITPSPTPPADPSYQDVTGLYSSPYL